MLEFGEILGFGGAGTRVMGWRGYVYRKGKGIG